MARQKNDGRGRMGGRREGTPNKATSKLKDWVAGLIDDNRERIEKDLEELDAKDRLLVLEKLMAYVLPKQTSNKTEINVSGEDERLDNRLRRLVGDDTAAN